MTHIKLLIALLLFSSLYIDSINAQTNKTFDSSKLIKKKQSLMLCWKSYNIYKNEKITLYGAKRLHWITNNWYWGESGYGALNGKRSGYLEGGITAGYKDSLTNNLLYDLRLFYGAGGGGSAPSGSGMIYHITLSFGYKVSEKLDFMLEYGYIDYLNGDIQSPTVGFNIRINTHTLLYDQ